MDINELPDFIQNRIMGMPEHVQKAFLDTITPDWVECQMATYEIVKGLDSGKWTIDDIHEAVNQSRKKIS